MKVSVRRGDVAILIGAVAIAVYEKTVADDEDLVSYRVAAYKRSHPLLTHAVVLLTAGHLLEFLHPRYDPYHWAMRYVRASKQATQRVAPELSPPRG